MRTTLFHDAARETARLRLTRALERANGARAAIRDTAVAMLHEIPGLSGMRYVDGRHAQGLPVFTIGVTGWSPTLHAMRMTQSVRMPPGDEGSEVAIDFTSRIHATLAERARDAQGYGLSGPPDAAARPPIAHHLVIDRSLAEIVRTRPGGCVATNVAFALREAHGQQATFGGYVHQEGGRAIERVGDPADRPSREIGWAVSLSGREFPRYDGGMLSLKAEGLPSTVTSAMRGRRLRDLVQVHPALDDRIVRELHVDDLGGETLYTVTFEPEPVALSDWIR